MSPSPPTTSSGRRALAALAVALGLFGIVFAGSVAVDAAPSQVPTSVATQGTPTTTQDLLAPTTSIIGPTTTAAGGAGATSTTSDNGAAKDKAADDNRRVWYVVAGLVAIAVALTGLTIWYWFRTRPSSRVAEGGGSPGRHGRGSAPVDHEPPAAVVAPRDVTGAVDGAPVTPVRGIQQVTVPANVRAAALGAGATQHAEHRPLTAADAPDHDASDQDWAPRGTGEHDRVEGDRPAIPRPDRSARAAALERARDTD